MTLPPRYIPAEHEPLVWKRWTTDPSRPFHADPKRVDRGAKPNHAPGAKRPPYCIVIPPPNVTGRLHLGHALNNTLQDILTRAHRMMGFETLWMPGTDHAGIATQAVVEKRLRESGELIGPLRGSEKFTREKFVERVQAWKEEYEAAITEQLQRMGCSCDYDRQRFTMDEIGSRAVREAFFRFFRDGLIYRGKRLVNWDPVLQTAVADDETEMEEVDGFFYYLRYPLTEKVTLPSGEVIDHVTVATTRPETYLGDTAVAMNPDDPRAKALVGKRVRLPLVGREIPIIQDSYVVLPAKDPDAPEVDAKAKYTTGFLKVTPGHDPNDYELGLRHKLPMINIMAPDGTISDKHGWTDVGEAKLFLGLKVSTAKAHKLVTAEFEKLGLLQEKKPYRHSVSHSERSGVPIEPYLSDQWYVKVTDDRMAPSANKALHSGEIEFHPARYAKTYESWHDNIRDWCISRQLWWGHRIPVWRKRITLTEKNWYDELIVPGLDDINTKESTKAGICLQLVRVATGTVVPWRTEEKKFFLFSFRRDSWLPVTKADEGEYDIFICTNDDSIYSPAALQDQGFERDPDVLDTWFSSALWPISTMGWPDGAESAKLDPRSDDFDALLKAFLPSNVLSTAREIITLWVSRMVMFSRYLMPEGWPQDQDLSHSGQGRGPVPFPDVFIHSVIQDGQGRKMSKSLGNGVDPLDIIDHYGADAMRFVLCNMTTQTQDVRMPVEKDPKTGKNTSPKFDMGRNFCTKLWNATRFALMNLGGGDAGSAASAPSPSGRGQGEGFQSSPARSSSSSSSSSSLIDRWMLSRVASTIKKVNESLANYEFSIYAQQMYDLMWRDFCDWYLEAIKPTVKTDASQQAVLRAALDSILRLLHPVCPFVTEALYEQVRLVAGAPVAGLNVPPSASGLLCTAPWPIAADALIDEKAEAEFLFLQELTDAIRTARATKNVEQRRKITLHADADLIARLSKDRVAGGMVESLAGLERVTADKPPQDAVLFTFRARECALSNLADAMDPAAEKTSLAEQVAKLDKDIAALAGRLNNAGYIQKAPPKLVEESKALLAQKEAERAAAARRLGELG
ncbi:MAG TPA: valine--tRNA ligase [Phycisphaerales bacterium]|nr:valine--tRNA ligase [Phycisphaerales bacterium]